MESLGTSVHTYEGLGYARAYSLAIDTSGNKYIAGIFTNETDLDFGPGIEVGINGSYEDSFITKLDSDGNTVWVKTIAGLPGNWVKIQSIDTDSTGNLYLAGTFNGSIDFDIGTGTMTLSSIGDIDGFVMKIDEAGDFVWAYDVGGSGFDECWNLAVDPTGNIYVTGSFSGTVDFDPGAGIYNLSSPFSTDAYVQKVDTDGNFLWAFSNSTSNTVEGYDIEIDENGDVILSGFFSDGIVDFDPGTGVLNLGGIWSYAYLQKIDSDANLIWAEVIKGFFYSDATIFSIATDADKNIYMTGKFWGSVDFDPGPGTFVITPDGLDGPEIFVLKLGETGNFKWATYFGSDDDDGSHAIAIDDSSNLFVTGFFEGDGDFDPGAEVVNLTIDGITDGFLISFDSTGTFRWVLEVGGPGNFDIAYPLETDLDNTLLLAGWYSDSVDFDPSLYDSTLLSVGVTEAFFMGVDECWPSTSSLNIETCEAFTVPSGDETYLSSGIYTDTIINSAGCDSIITFNLTILETTFNSLIISACDSYTVPSGDETYYVSGLYTDTLLNSSGCDSILTIDLEIPVVDIGVSYLSPTIIADFSSADSYQWIDCTTLDPIAGETSPDFTPAANGSYAVIINDGGCIDTSACVEILDVGYPGISSNEINIYPNPAFTRLVLESHRPLIGKGQVYSLTNQLVLEFDYQGVFSEINISELAKGPYIVRIVADQQNTFVRFIKN